MKLDIGCGSLCLPGFVGVDRFPLPGVQIVADLDKALPLEDDSVELVHASHSLEHVSDLMFTMKELYRVCKHKAQICIIAPYFEQKLNLANPYHLQVFNEHTPRFWTNFPSAPIDGEEYFHPHAPLWGLSTSDNSDPGLDIRLLRMEFLYFPRFSRLDSAWQRELRQHLTDVCQQMVYHLIVWKSDEDDDYVRLMGDLDDYPFLETPPLLASRLGVASSQSEASATFANIEKYFDDKFQGQVYHIAECERRLRRSEKLMKFFTGTPDLPAENLARLDNFIRSSFRFIGHRKFGLSKNVTCDGYLEYSMVGEGLYDSVSICIYLSDKAKSGRLGIEIVDKNNSIAWNSMADISHVDTIGVVDFSLGKTFRQGDVRFLRIFGRGLDVEAQVFECTLSPRWPFLRGKLVPYACLSKS